MKSFIQFLQEEEEKSTLDTTTWSTEKNSGSLRELLGSPSSLQPIEIQRLLPKTTKWEGDESQWERVKQVDLSHPITVITGKNGEIHTIADGHHRIHAANAQGMTHINATVIPYDSMPEKFQEIFST